MNRGVASIIQILLMLILIIGFFASYSMNRSYKILGIEIKQAPMQNFFLEKPQVSPQIQENAKFFLAYQNTVKAEPKPVLDTTKQVILLTGDSMVGSGIAIGLKKFSEYNQHKITAVSFESTTTIHWSKTKKLDSLIQVYQPTLVILSLGSNELFTKNIVAHQPYIEDIIKQAGDTKFIWVGPPNWQEDTGINDLLKNTVGEDKFFLSKDLELSRLSDGVHINRKGSLVWAEAFTEWLKDESVYKIYFKNPLKEQKL